MEVLNLGVALPLATLIIPVTYALAGAVGPHRAGRASAIAFVLAWCIACSSWAVGASPAHGVRLDAATCVMLPLVTSLGLVIVRFSRTYLDGDLGLERYFRRLMQTLSAVTLLIISNNLLVIAVAWTAVSVCLHGLLTFYADRPAALVAAHKKFLVSRLADCALAGSLGVMYASVGSFDLDHIAAWVNLRSELPASMEFAASLMVVAVSLRSAQLPFHGWITQVMEAPTPVSALLHAGVVNMGGFILIRLSPWMSGSRCASLLLVSIGLTTAVVAALVMMTRVSVKVALAWSTCAQMGFMLVQCGLGLWSLALLHLVAHSLYKAYAFLTAGAAVEEWKARAISPPRESRSLTRIGAALGVSLVTAYVGVTVLTPYAGLAPLHGSSAWLMWLILALSLVSIFANRLPGDARGLLATTVRVLGIVALYVGAHALVERVLPGPHVRSSEGLWWLTGAGLVGLFLIKSALEWRPEGALARMLHPWLFSGLYLDEVLTKWTFRLWPPRRALPTERALRTLRAPAALEVQS